MVLMVVVLCAWQIHISYALLTSEPGINSMTHTFWDKAALFPQPLGMTSSSLHNSCRRNALGGMGLSLTVLVGG